MIHVEPGIQRLEAERLSLPGRRLRHHGPTPRARHRVQVDRVDHAAALMVLEVQLDGVAQTHTQKRPGDLAVERPVVVRRLVREPADELHGLQVER